MPTPYVKMPPCITTRTRHDWRYDPAKGEYCPHCDTRRRCEASGPRQGTRTVIVVGAGSGKPPDWRSTS